MIAKCIIGLFLLAAAFLCVATHSLGTEPPSKQPPKKEVPPLAKEIIKVKIERRVNEKVEDDPASKTIQDKEKIGQLLALFPEVGTDKKPDAFPEGPRGYGAAYFITLYREKGDPFYIVISHNREFWCWSQGKAVSNGDWNLTKKKAKEVGKFLDDLLK